MTATFATLHIGRTSSRCSACGNGADMNESQHLTRYGYGEHDGKGCGAVYTRIVEDYVRWEKQ